MFGFFNCCPTSIRFCQYVGFVFTLTLQRRKTTWIPGHTSQEGRIIQMSGHKKITAMLIIL
jgi:hypothetical protein